MEPIDPSTSVSVDLTDEDANEEITLSLTRGQLQLINEFLSQNIQPRGYEMIAFAFDMFKRLNDALEVNEDTQTFGSNPGE
jgi:hypothetical protein